MKKVLFATTALIATAGMASADVSWSGSAGAGVYDDGDTEFYNFIELTATLSGESDNGLTFGGSFDLQTGPKFDVGDFEYDGNQAGQNDNDSSTFGTLFISGDFGTITFDREGTDNMYDSGFSHDVKYEYDMAGFSFALTFDDTSASGNGDQWSAMLGYSMDGISASITTDDSSSFVIDAAYDVTAEINVAISHDVPDGGGSVTELSVAYDDGTVSADASIDTDDSWSIGLGYTVDGISVAASTDDAEEWEITGSYDLGGGLTVVTGVNFDEVFYLGAAMEF